MGLQKQSWPLRAIRLWEHDAQTALASGALGLAILSPLMRNPSAELVEQAAQLVRQQAPETQQPDLLVILSVFAEPLLPTDRIISLIGREQLMASDLISYLTQEKLAEQEARYQQQMKEQLAEQETRYKEQLADRNKDLLRALKKAITSRFPNAPLTLDEIIDRIDQPDMVVQLIGNIVQAPDYATVERELTAAVEKTPNS